MRQTSLDAYKGIKNELPEKRKRILEAIGSAGSKGATLFELVDITGQPVNEISGRVTELSKMGIIIGTGTRVNPRSERAAIVWGAGEQ